MALPLCVIISLFLRKSALQPASHNFPMDRRDPDLREGKMCAWVACFGSPGMLRCATCVEIMLVPFGRSAKIGVVAGFMSCKATFVCTK